ncbi:cytochrome P450 4A4-like isoform X2 [Mytilus edulis]|uniref:cytochrome P450 4A4-like isoform X2 n=1 Tax=Mytilus edulis TaxID=6550 RepID=UPI0039EE8EC4
MGVMLMSILVGLVVLILSYVVIRLFTFIRWYKKIKKVLSHFPGPKPHWLFGNALQIGCFHDFVCRNHEEYVEKQNAKAYTFWLFINRPILQLTHPDTIKVLMKSNAPKAKSGAGYLFVLPWLGDSLLVSDGPKWERNRRLLTPGFHFSVLNGYFEVYNDVADTLLEKFASSCKDGKYIEIFKLASLATLDTLLQCSLSYKGNVQLVGENHPYVKAVKRLVTLVLARALNIFLYNPILFRLSSTGREFYKLCDFVHQFSEDIIAKRRKELANNQDSEKKKQLDFLDILLTATDDNGNGLTNEEIRNEVDTFMFAGHDTTASALSWSMYSLGKHKDIQEKVYKEVREVVGDKQYIDSDDISKMKYLSMFVKEVLRCHSPVPTVSRMIKEPCVVEGVEFPEGSIFDLSMFDVHHNSHVWPEPWEFKPERFEEDKHHEMDPYSFVPFSAGPRNCIGQAFAQHEEKVLIARIVNRFEISLDPDHKVEHFMEVVMRAKNGIMVNFKERS